MFSIKAVTGHMFFVTRFIITVARLNADSTKAIRLFIGAHNETLSIVAMRVRTKIVRPLGSTAEMLL
jgi:hypothetical protein